MDSATINRGLRALSQVDEDLAQAIKQLGPPQPRSWPEGFEALLQIVVSQQISTEAARAILNRLQGLMPSTTPQAFLALKPSQLRQAGLSARKVEYTHGLAVALDSGEFDLAAVERLDDQAGIAAVTQLRGFGRWSAEIYLMFALGRPDIFAADDLALRIALGRLKALPEPPSPAQSRQLTRHWRPWRSVGSLFLWHYYRGAPG